MTRKKRTDRPNPFLEDDRKELLDDLDHVQNLLGDAAEDVPADRVPLLEADEGEQNGPDGSTEEQIPLLGGDPSAETPRPARETPGDGPATTAAATVSQPDENRPPESREALRKRLAERDNPFLPRERLDELKSQRTKVQQDLDALQSRESTAARQGGQQASERFPASESGSGRSDDPKIRAVVDELLAEWMPRLESELRERLTRRLTATREDSDPGKG